MQTLSIVMPCYNERATIQDILRVVAGVKIPYNKEIIIIDDCSKDGTREFLQSGSLDSVISNAQAKLDEYFSASKGGEQHI